MKTKLPKVITVRVTREHIDKGNKVVWQSQLPQNCPIALAITEKYGKGASTSVAKNIIINGRVWKGRMAPNEFFAHSKRSTKWVNDFDKGKDVKPAIFRFKRTSISLFE